MISLDKTALRGSIPPLITPFKDGAVDYDAYAKLVEFQAANGSHGVLINGTTSEPSSLTVEERNRLVDVGVEAAADDLTVVVATGSQSYAETEALTLHAAASRIAFGTHQPRFASSTVLARRPSTDSASEYGS